MHANVHRYSLRHMLMAIALVSIALPQCQVFAGTYADESQRVQDSIAADMTALEWNDQQRVELTASIDRFVVLLNGANGSIEEQLAATEREMAAANVAENNLQNSQNQLQNLYANRDYWSGVVSSLTEESDYCDAQADNLEDQILALQLWENELWYNYYASPGPDPLLDPVNWIQEIDMEIWYLEQDVDYYRATAADMRRDIPSAEAQVNSAEAQIPAAETEVQQRDAQLQQYEQNIQEMQNTLSNLESYAAGYEDEIFYLSESLSTYTSECNTLTARVSSAMAWLSQYPNEAIWLSNGSPSW